MLLLVEAAVAALLLLASAVALSILDVLVSYLVQKASLVLIEVSVDQGCIRVSVNKVVGEFVLPTRSSVTVGKTSVPEISLVEATI